MTLILFFTVTGFLIGLSYVMIKRKIKPGAIFTAAFLGLLSAGIWKILKEYFKAKGRRKYY